MRRVVPFRCHCGPSGLEGVGVVGSGRVDLAAEIRASTGMDFEPEGTVTWSADGTETAVANAADGQLYAIRLDCVDLCAVI